MFGLFEGWDPDDVDMVKVLALDLLNLFFVYGGYRLAKSAKRKQKQYYERYGFNSDVSYSEIFFWLATFASGLILAYAFPVLFFDVAIRPFSSPFDRPGLLALLTRYLLCLNVVYIMFKAPRVALRVGAFGITFVLPIILITGYYWG